ncbi:extended synaptotagmin-2-like isoform X1 [Artemia franciscana]|uniref:extended synaptotagmin-2-like isoform X1 n=2 Tax=Artemia franciscana TaxID=6661 RepID=UPI0032DA16B4
MDIFDGLNSSSSDDDDFNFNEMDSIDGFFRPPKEKNGSGFLEHRTFNLYTSMAASNGDASQVQEVKDEEPSQPPTPSSQTVSTGSLKSIMKRFLQHFPLLLGLYMAGYFRMSLVWIVGAAGLTAVREQWRKERDFRMNSARLANFIDESDIIKARVVDLPSWVFFPDYERAEWVNRILKSVWPNVSKFIEKIVEESIEPSVREALNAYKLTGFRFEKIRLGSIPLRIGGVKVYDRNVSRNEIIMDMDLCYAGDCDFRFVVKGMRAGIKDFQIKGLMRCIMKPLVDASPFVGGLQLFFLNNPDIDFNLLGVADVFDMPGLADIMRKIISDQVGAMMVLPNKITVQMHESVKADTLKMHEPAGVLRVRLIEAKDLMKMDVGMLGRGKSDPYAVINVGSQEFRTKTITNTVNPKWDFVCEVTVESMRCQVLSVRVWDYDPPILGKNDDYLGRATVDIHSLVKAGKKELWAKLEDVQKGAIHLELTWFALSKDPLRLKDHTHDTISVGLSTGVVSVFIDACKMLPYAKGSTSPPEAYAIISVGNRTAQTNIQQRSCDPVFEQAFSFLVCNPESDDLYIKVMDQKTNTEIGRAKIVLVSLLNERDLTLSRQPLPLKNSGPDSKVVISVQLRIMVQGTIGDEPPPTPLSTTPAVKPIVTPSVTPVAKVAPVPLPEPLKLEPAPVITPKETAEVAAVKPQETLTGPAETPAPVEEKKKDYFSEVADDKDQKKGTGIAGLISAASSAAAPVMPPVVNISSLPTERSTPSLRRRQVQHEGHCGRVQLTLRYSTSRQKFIVVVHQAEKLPIPDPTDLPDPYVKLYLLPDKKESGKRKTEAIVDTNNPHYDESFEFNVSYAELPTRTLEVSVLSKKQSFFSKTPLIGFTKLDLSVFDWQNSVTDWFDLGPGSD